MGETTIKYGGATHKRADAIMRETCNMMTDIVEEQLCDLHEDNPDLSAPFLISCIGLSMIGVVAATLATALEMSDEDCARLRDAMIQSAWSAIRSLNESGAA